MFIALRSFPNAILIIFVELFIGSKGYLFFAEIFGVQISIRLMFFVIIMLVWLYLFVKNIRQGDLNIAKIRLYIQNNIYLKLLFVLLFIIAFATINAFLRQNSLSDIFFDLNGWLFLGILFPLFSLPLFYENKLKDFLNNLLAVFLAGIVWISLKTLILLYLFSHLAPWLDNIYRWVRESGVGEITMMPGNFYRIFIQSQIFVLAGIIVVLILLLKTKKRRQSFFLHLCMILFLSTTIVSLSRSNWLGLACSLLLFFLGYSFVYFRPFKKYFNYILRFIGVIILSAVFVFMIVKIPWPGSDTQVDTFKSIRDRTGNIANEAGAASRWALWPEMLKEIKKGPFLGRGFGTTISYASSDPRALESNPDKLYTTFSFEWGWLDVWLKLGIFGLLVYAGIFVILIVENLKKFFQQRDIIYLGLVCLLVLMAVINFFSPYLNHPLGIGFLLIIIFFSCQKKQNIIY
ncbi:MAG: O-antigen ligase family protein [Patescibacteria group bacterium]|nr:O-antigen ligase family protein [Patescibacteria group bacterium]